MGWLAFAHWIDELRPWFQRGCVLFCFFLLRGAYTSIVPPEKKEPQIKHYVTWLEQQQQRRQKETKQQSLSPPSPLPSRCQKPAERCLVAALAEGSGPRRLCRCLRNAVSRAAELTPQVLGWLTVVRRLAVLAEGAGLQTGKFVHAGGLLRTFHKLFYMWDSLVALHRGVCMKLQMFLP